MVVMGTVLPLLFTLVLAFQFNSIFGCKDCPTNSLLNKVLPGEINNQENYRPKRSVYLSDNVVPPHLKYVLSLIKQELTQLNYQQQCQLLSNLQQYIQTMTEPTCHSTRIPSLSITPSVESVHIVTPGIIYIPGRGNLAYKLYIIGELTGQDNMHQMTVYPHDLFLRGMIHIPSLNAWSKPFSLAGIISGSRMQVDLAKLSGVILQVISVQMKHIVTTGMKVIPGPLQFHSVPGRVETVFHPPASPYETEGHFHTVYRAPSTTIHDEVGNLYPSALSGIVQRPLVVGHGLAGGAVIKEATPGLISSHDLIGDGLSSGLAGLGDLELHPLAHPHPLQTLLGAKK